MNTSETLPVRFDFDSGTDRKSLQQGDFLRFVHNWALSDGTLIPATQEFLVIGITEAIQLWCDGKPLKKKLKRPGEPLPDVTALNSEIPTETWELGLDGKPRGPWRLEFVVYFLNESDGAVFTYANSTAGARIAVGRLRHQIQNMRALRGVELVPCIRLGCKDMPTKYGPRPRPEFMVSGWRELGLALTEPPKIPPKSSPPASSDDGLPW